jgi:hypothetical protein
MRVLDLAVSPDGSKLLVVGIINPDFSSGVPLTGLGLENAIVSGGSTEWSPRRSRSSQNGGSAVQTNGHSHVTNGGGMGGAGSGAAGGAAASLGNGLMRDQYARMRRRLVIYDRILKEEVA